MTPNTTTATEQAVDPAPAAPPPGGGNGRRRIAFDLRVDSLSGLYLAVALIVVFSVWLPETFATGTTLRAVLAGSAITGIVALAATLGLISGAFDISVGATMSFAIAMVGWSQSLQGMNAMLSVGLTLLGGALVGVVNAFVITRLHVQPVIATLGMSSLLAAASFWLTGGQTLVNGISPAFTQFGRQTVLTIPVPVLYLLGIALLLWYFLEHTPVGRYMYAAGANPHAARLAGLPVVRLQWTALVMSGTLSAFAGVVLTMQLGAASFGAGAPYLLPAFAAAFLGSTQIKQGRFNVAGTIVALYLLAIGVKGLQLRWPGIPWIADLFQGVALIAAVAVGVVALRRRARRA